MGEWNLSEKIQMVMVPVIHSKICSLNFAHDFKLHLKFHFVPVCTPNLIKCLSAYSVYISFKF